MWHFTERGVVTVLGAGLLLGSGCISLAAIPEQQERHFKVKDSGAILPGHGGILDRMDSMATASIILAIIIMLSPEIFQ